MQARSRSVLLGVVAVALAGAATTYWRGNASGSGLICAWRPDNDAAYLVKVGSSATFHEGVITGDTSQPPRQVALSYEARLDVRAAAGSERPNTYVAKLQLLKGLGDRAATLRTDLERVFVFAMDADCRFGEFGFADAEGRESRDLKKGLLVTMESIARPQDATAEAWQARQADAIGEFDASYHQDAETGDIRRRRLSYAKTFPFGTMPLKADVINSSATFTPSASFWLAKASVQESLKVTTDNAKPFLQSSASIRFEAADGPGEMGDAAVAEFKWEPLRVEASTKMTSSNYDNVGGDSLTSASGTLSDAMDAFAKGDFYSGKIDRQAVGNMVHFLRANPEAIQTLLDQIKAGEVDPRLHAFLFFTLTKVGTPEAQRALTRAMRDAEHTEESRMQAMHALADVDKPLPESVDALIDMAKPFSPQSTDENNLESTALLALGVVERHQLDGQAPDLGKRAAEALLDRLKGDVNDEEKSVLVEALGNTGNPAHTRVIIDHFNDDSAAVRVSAARALSRMSFPDSDQALMDAVQRETNADSRREIASAWAQKMGETGAFDAGKAADMLAKEPAETIRLSLVDVLGRQAATQPSVKAALARQYAKETSAKVKYAIGKFLSADDIARGSAGH